MEQAAADAGEGQISGLEKVPELCETSISGQEFADPLRQVIRDVRKALYVVFEHSKRVQKLVGKVIGKEREEGNIFYPKTVGITVIHAGLLS